MQAARGTPLTSGPDAAAEVAPPRRRLLLLFALVAAAAYTVDVVSKVLAVSRLTDRGPVQVVGRFLQLDLTRNPGAAFSTGTHLTELLTVLAITAVVAVLWFSRKLGTRSWAVALGLLLGGIGGNLTDRLLRSPGPFRGHVVDFLQLPHWPTFNVADICIDAGAALAILLTLRGVPLEGRPTPPASS